MAKRSPAHSIDQRRDDGEGQRNFDREGRAGADRGFEVDGAADRVDIGLDDVHADAAAGDAGDGIGGREAGAEDEFVDLRVGHSVEIGLAGEPGLGGLAADPVGVETAPVIGDLDDDVAAFVIGGDGDRALFGLAGGTPLRRGSPGHDRPSCGPCG